MFNNEQIELNTDYVAMNFDQNVSQLIQNLENSKAVHIEWNDRHYLFTASDISRFLVKEGHLQDLLSEWSPSPIIDLDNPHFSRGEWISDLPDDLDRPILFVSESNQITGFLSLFNLLKQIAAQKHKAEAYLNSLLDTVTDAVTAVDRKGTVICWNETAVSIYDIPYERIMGRTIGEHFDPDSLMLLRSIDEGRIIRNMYHKSREGTHVLINASPVKDYNGQIIGGLASEQDITHLVRLNEELTSAQASILDTLPRKDDPFSHIDGQSHSISKVVRIGKKMAESDTPVILYGESGVGKEQLAKVIHLASPRAEHPFLSINCGAVPVGMLESELFGFEGGTFSGNNHYDPGKLELADKGTLLLNEIDKLPMDVQDKLYHALKNQSFRRYGGHTDIPLNTRIIGASKHNLEELAASQNFSSELYYTLSIVSIPVPPLRDRIEDISILSTMYLREFSAQYQKPIPVLTPEVILAFSNYAWPGNIAELRAVLERCVILGEGDQIKLEHLPDSFLEHFGAISDGEQVLIEHIHYDNRLKAKVSETEEKALIEEALHKAAGNKSVAAKLLGISRGTLYNKMKKHYLE
ncbi:hypothetical protein TCA2_0050 [Paenibacillus sp. TCA20]|uniref:sigma-54 interaction domain-containing protein n=1 Tax=Paenibacillus sp. TCA20 TaxID=1499968 RepID=UPI0004D6B9BE|nr:sigma-54-dependent Fis family transcriptional regulator [Paenibacillus sp. TCA20]GAK38324.1 hypothetical protein TCA2_0050 [Paenibacillus sp. TCA20]